MEGNIVMDKDIKRSIILDNYQNPNNKRVSGTDSVSYTHLTLPTT